MSHKSVAPELRTELAREAMRAALDVRFQLGLGVEEPICIYSTCERLGVPARFVDVSMEGIYTKRLPPRILLSAHRPLVRRHFNCAHELGHHVFGHGTTLHHLTDALTQYNDQTPEEILANSFASHLLMPVLGIRRAFSRRRTEPRDAQPVQILAIASEFGVGYETLVTQLAFSFKDISIERYRELLTARPSLRRSLCPMKAPGLSLLDHHFCSPTLDVETNHVVIAPAGAIPSGEGAALLRNTPLGPLFRLATRGSLELLVPNSSWTVTIRIAEQNFVGLARFRYLEDAE